MRARLAILLMLLILTVWITAPLHGFVSHQFGIAQSPFGWQSMPASATPQSQWTASKNDRKLADRAMLTLAQRRRSIGAPSISAAIIQSGKLRWAGSVGWADIARGVPATTDTRYRAGSTSKAVTASLLARMVDAAIISVDLRMEECIVPIPNEKWRAITVRQLASHTAGIVGYQENRDITGLYQSMALQSRFASSSEALSVFDGSDLLFEPGTGYHYSSYDFVLIAACLETKGNQPFQQLMDRFVTSPLGLDALEVDGIRPVSGNLAQFYLRSDAGYRPWRRVDLSHRAAGGGLVATPATIAHIGAAWLDDDFLSPATRELFWTPVRLANGKVNEEDYALGWRRKTWQIEGVGDVENLNHGGVSKGSQFWLMVVPEHDLSLAVAMNGLTDSFFDFADVSRDILSVFLSHQPKNAEGPPVK